MLRINEGLAGFWVSRGMGIPQNAVSVNFHKIRRDAEIEVDQIQHQDDLAALDWMRKFESILVLRNK